VIHILNHGSVAIVSPDADDDLLFADFLFESGLDEVTGWGRGIVVEPRYLPDLVGALIEHGFQVTEPEGVPYGPQTIG